MEPVPPVNIKPKQPEATPRIPPRPSQKQEKSATKALKKLLLAITKTDEGYHIATERIEEAMDEAKTVLNIETEPVPVAKICDRYTKDKDEYINPSVLYEQMLKCYRKQDTSFTFYISFHKLKKRPQPGQVVKVYLTEYSEKRHTYGIIESVVLEVTIYDNGRASIIEKPVLNPAGKKHYTVADCSFNLKSNQVIMRK